MVGVINQSPSWEFVGRVSAITGLVCFPHGSPYRMSLGKLGYGGFLVYLFVCSFLWWLMIWGKRIQVPEKFKGVVEAILFVVLCSITVVYDKYVPRESDAYTITSYGSFALMSVSLSRKLELGLETGFSAFFLQQFFAHLSKTKWYLLPFAIVFCCLVRILRSYPEPGVVDIGNEETTHLFEPGLRWKHFSEFSQSAVFISHKMELWNFVGDVSAIYGLVSFPQGSSYHMSFGKLGYGGFLVYLFVCSFLWCLMMRGKRIQVSEKVKVVVGAMFFVVICSISELYDKYVPGKSDAYTITSYGSFALMSVSLSRKLELGFETGFCAFFLQLFAAQFFKIKWFLYLIALVFCFLVIIPRHHSEPRLEDIGNEESTHLVEPGT